MNVNMRFSGVSMSHNPKTLKITRSKKINSAGRVGGENRLDNVSDGISKISGTGEIYGLRCFSVYEELMRMCFKNKAGVLSVPELGIFRAVLEDISVMAEPKENFLTVAFVFRVVNDRDEPKKILPEQYVLPVGGESLWDIAYRYDVPIEKLLKLNPQIRKIFNLSGVVRLY